MRDSGDFVDKYVQVVTRNENEIEATLISIEQNGLLLKGNDIFYFIPSESIDFIQYDPSGEY